MTALQSRGTLGNMILTGSRKYFPVYKSQLMKTPKAKNHIKGPAKIRILYSSLSQNIKDTTPYRKTKDAKN